MAVLTFLDPLGVLTELSCLGLEGVLMQICLGLLGEF